MKRAFVLSICLLTAVVGMMAQTQNKFWRTTISTTGLYGACDEKGNSTIPNVFQRMGFWGTNAVSFVEYDSRFFVIDRKGEMVGGESWDEEPVIFDRFVMAGNKDERFLMDLHGNRLPVEGTEVTLMKGWNWVADNLMLHSRAADSTYQLHGIDGTLVVNECSTIELLNRLPLVKYLRKGTKIAITGRIQTGSYTNRDGVRVYTTDVIVEEQEFAESKNSSGAGGDYSGGANTQAPASGAVDGFMNIPDGIDEELPFS